MATTAQIEAARRNGAKSRGPVTPEGKERSSQNATQHGLSAKRLLVLSNESDELFITLFNQLKAALKPVDHIEESFVMQAAAARWRLRRAWIVETGLIDMQMDVTQPYLQETFRSFDEGTRQAVAFKSLVDESRALDLIGRYEARLSREYDRAIRGLERIRAGRDRKTQPATPPLSEQPETGPGLTPSSAGSSKLQNEPEPAAAVEQKLQNEPKTSAGSDFGIITVDPRHAGIVDQLLADPSVRAVLDHPDQHR